MQSGNAEKLVGLDNLSTHCHSVFCKYSKEKTNSLLVYTPEDCIDLCAVTDAGLGKSIKDMMRAKFNRHYEGRSLSDIRKFSNSCHYIYGSSVISINILCFKRHDSVMSDRLLEQNPHKEFHLIVDFT